MPAFSWKYLGMHGNVIQYSHFLGSSRDQHANEEVLNSDAVCSVSYEFRMSDTVDIDLVCNRSLTYSIQRAKMKFLSYGVLRETNTEERV
jgi:hypothetical protein